MIFTDTIVHVKAPFDEMEDQNAEKYSRSRHSQENMDLVRAGIAEEPIMSNSRYHQ